MIIILHFIRYFRHFILSGGILIVMLSLNISAKAQTGPDYEITTDSTFLLTHSPHKATFLSACIPGLGQIYNQKYWKVPIIYAGFTGLIYYANYNANAYKEYKEGYEIKLKIEAGNTQLTDKFELATKDNLESLKDTWRRYRDLTYISIGILYVMQILDANVDAHLFDYDISEDLSLRLEPSLLQTPNFSNQKYYQSASLGVRCSIRF